MMRAVTVALPTEGVDRNLPGLLLCINSRLVALPTEGVDRNLKYFTTTC